MCSEQPRVQPNAADPLRHETGVLPSCHALPRATSSGEQEFAGLLVSRTDVVIDCLPGLLGHLEPDRLPGLLLSDRRPIDGVPTRGNILDLESDDITIALFAVDSEVEHCQVSRLSFDLELGPDRPNML